MTEPHSPVVLELPSESGMAAVARATVRAVLECSPGIRFDEREIDEVALVVQEACTNAVRHAHGRDPSKRLRLEVLRREGEIEITVLDEGQPFDMEDTAPIDPESLREGGYGLHIMRSWMDEVSVRHDGRGNALRLVRRYRTPAPGGVRAGGV